MISINPPKLPPPRQSHAHPSKLSLQNMVLLQLSILFIHSLLLFRGMAFQSSSLSHWHSSQPPATTISRASKIWANKNRKFHALISSLVLSTLWMRHKIHFQFNPSVEFVTEQPLLVTDGIIPRSFDTDSPRSLSVRQLTHRPAKLSFAHHRHIVLFRQQWRHAITSV